MPLPSFLDNNEKNDKPPSSSLLASIYQSSEPPEPSSSSRGRFAGSRRVAPPPVMPEQPEMSNQAPEFLPTNQDHPRHQPPPRSQTKNKKKDNETKDSGKDEADTARKSERRGSHEGNKDTACQDITQLCALPGAPDCQICCEPISVFALFDCQHSRAFCGKCILRVKMFSSSDAKSQDDRPLTVLVDNDGKPVEAPRAAPPARRGRASARPSRDDEAHAHAHTAPASTSATADATSSSASSITPAARARAAAAVDFMDVDYAQQCRARHVKCPICYNVQRTLVLTTSPTALFTDFVATDGAQPAVRPTPVPSLGVLADSPALAATLAKLGSCFCPECDRRRPGRTPHTFPSLRALKAHAEQTHSLAFCTACAAAVPCFSHERRLMSQQQLLHHYQKGEKAKDDQSAIKPHPFCRFCKEPYFSSDELYAHLLARHHSCRFCHSQTMEFYRTAAALAAHTRTEHFVCELGTCKSDDPSALVAFSNQLDFSQHKAEFHGDKAAKKLDLSQLMSSAPARPAYATRGRGHGRGRVNAAGRLGEGVDGDVVEFAFERDDHTRLTPEQENEIRNRIRNNQGLPAVMPAGAAVEEREEDREAREVEYMSSFPSLSGSAEDAAAQRKKAEVDKGKEKKTKEAQARASEEFPSLGSLMSEQEQFEMARSLSLASYQAALSTNVMAGGAAPGATVYAGNEVYGNIYGSSSNSSGSMSGVVVGVEEASLPDFGAGFATARIGAGVGAGASARGGWSNLGGSSGSASSSGGSTGGAGLSEGDFFPSFGGGRTTAVNAQWGKGGAVGKGLAKGGVGTVGSAGFGNASVFFKPTKQKKTNAAAAPAPSSTAEWVSVESDRERRRKEKEEEKRKAEELKQRNEMLKAAFAPSSTSSSSSSSASALPSSTSTPSLSTSIPSSTPSAATNKPALITAIVTALQPYLHEALLREQLLALEPALPALHSQLLARVAPATLARAQRAVNPAEVDLRANNITTALQQFAAGERGAEAVVDYVLQRCSRVSAQGLYCALVDVARLGPAKADRTAVHKYVRELWATIEARLAKEAKDGAAPFAATAPPSAAAAPVEVLGGSFGAMLPSKKDKKRGKGANKELEAALAASRAEAKEAQRSAWASVPAPSPASVEPVAEAAAGLHGLSLSSRTPSLSPSPSLGETLSPPAFSPSASLSSPSSGLATLSYRMNNVTSPALLEHVSDLLQPVRATLTTQAATGITYTQVLATCARDALRNATGAADLSTSEAITSVAVDATTVKALSRALTTTNTAPAAATMLPELDRVFLSRGAADALRAVASAFRSSSGTNANNQRSKIAAVLARFNVVDLVKVWEYACSLLRCVCSDKNIKASAGAPRRVADENVVVYLPPKKGRK